MVQMKKLVYYVGYGFYLCVLIGIVDYCFYYFYIQKIIPPDLSHEIIWRTKSRIGYVFNDKKSSYLNFKHEKKGTTVRIGCFGDSFTYGEEVNEMYDYPSLLQALFKKAGYDNIEVINFGIKWIGFHQAFMMWKYIGRQYKLDCVLLGPDNFYINRDSTFNHTYNQNYIHGYPEYLHARYILKNNDEGVELIDVIGKRYDERISHYFRFIPHLQYLRYDYEAPVFMRAPVAWLLPNRKIKRNPFYYKKDVKKELDDIYKILLSYMADNVPHVILSHYYRPHIVSLGEECNKENLFSILVYLPQHFPYRAFANHMSPCGNRLLAQQMFDCLTNKQTSTLSILKTADVDEEMPMDVDIEKRKLSDYEDITVELNNIVIGRFYNLQFLNLSGGKTKISDDNNVFSQVDALLSVRDDHPCIVDRAFIPVPFELEENMPVTMCVKTHQGVKNYSLGYVQLLHSGVNMGTIDLGSTHFDHGSKIITVNKDNHIINNVGPLDERGTITILLNNTPVLTAEMRGPYSPLSFTPVHGEFIALRADGNELIDVQELDQHGLIYLTLYSRHNQRTLRIPFAQWKKTSKDVFLGNRRSHCVPLTLRHDHKHNTM